MTFKQRNENANIIKFMCPFQLKVQKYAKPMRKRYVIYFELIVSLVDKSFYKNVC